MSLMRKTTRKTNDQMQLNGVGVARKEKPLALLKRADSCCRHGACEYILRVGSRWVTNVYIYKYTYISIYFLPRPPIV